MADYNRNQRGSQRMSNQEWNENRNRMSRDDDRNYDAESRNYENENRDYESELPQWQGRQYNDLSRAGSYSTGRYGRHYDSDLMSGNFPGDRDYGYSPYYGSGMNYLAGNYRTRSRDLYDRDYEDINRRGYSNMGTRLGAANYGNYGDRGRTDREMRDERNYGDRGRGHEERGWWDRASDEVSSWFGNEDAELRRERDRRIQGEHRGKGPKNYTRSDERIQEDINDRLSDDPFIDATDIEVVVTNGEVTLTGTVDRRSAKRRAEDLAEEVLGVKNVENRIRVSQPVSSEMTGNSSYNQTTGTFNSGAANKPAANEEKSSQERSRNKSFVTG